MEALLRWLIGAPPGHWRGDHLKGSFDIVVRASWLSVPARGHRGRGALVPALRPVLPRCRGAARRAGHRGRPRHGLPVGANLHSRVHRRRPSGPPRERQSMVRRRNVPEGRRPLEVSVSGSRSAWQVIDVLVSKRRDASAARRFFARALATAPTAVELTTDRAPVYPRVLEEVLRPRATSLSGMRTTESKPITVG